MVFWPSGYLSRSIDVSTAFLISCEFLGRMNLQLELLFIILVVKNYVSTWPRLVVELYFYLLRTLLVPRFWKEPYFSSRAVKLSLYCFVTKGILGGFPSIFSEDFAEPIPPIFYTDM